MAQRVTAIFTNREDAEHATDRLIAMGADRSDISTVVRHTDTYPAAGQSRGENVIEPAREVGDTGAPLTTSDPGDTAKGAEAGAVIGAIAGIAAGAAMLAVPGVGLILAAGPLSWAIGGAVGATIGGAVAGGVYGHLRDIGINEQYARAYEERIRGGDLLMTALIPGLNEARVREMLDANHAEDMTFVDDPMTVASSPPAYAAPMAQTSPSAASDMSRTSAAPAVVSETYAESTMVTDEEAEEDAEAEEQLDQRH